MQGAASALYQGEYSQASGITVDGVTLANGKRLNINAGNQYNGYSGNITLRRTRITGWSGDSGDPPLILQADLGNLVSRTCDRQPQRWRPTAAPSTSACRATVTRRCASRRWR
jgi:hypothetical protein